MFLNIVDHQFSPITTLHKNGKIVKKIPWSAFRLSNADWQRVKLCTELLDVSAISVMGPSGFPDINFLQDVMRYLQYFYKDGVLLHPMPTRHQLQSRPTPDSATLVCLTCVSMVDHFFLSAYLLVPDSSPICFHLYPPPISAYA